MYTRQLNSREYRTCYVSNLAIFYRLTRLDIYIYIFHETFNKTLVISLRLCFNFQHFKKKIINQ